MALLMTLGQLTIHRYRNVWALNFKKSYIHTFSGRNGSFFLKQRLAEQVDYTPVPEILFKRLERFYHIDDDRRDYIQRRVVRKDGKLCIEVYPRIVHV